jgi:prepilin-type N-terminal cleavage/methylation domain-containing protein/prepilin-type processing-associated H-X9-DG protein
MFHRSWRAKIAPASRVHVPAFTLVELLVVIGIIGILLAIFLPVLARAREAASQVKCLSNVRQISVALIAYTHANKGWLPGAAMGNQRRHDDWIHWQTIGPSRDLQESAIAPHMSRPLTAAQLACPSDDLSLHTNNWFFNSEGPYRYSYSVNSYLVGNPMVGRRQIKINTIRRVSEIILVVEESEKSINDGVWVPERHDPDYDLLAIRHDRFAHDKPPATWGGPGPELQHPARRGNAGFVDGHAEFVPRLQAHSSEYHLPSK